MHTTLQPYRQDSFLFLDEVTRRSLELTRTLRDGGRAGSLLAVLDRTATPELLHERVTADVRRAARLIDTGLRAFGPPA